MDRDGTQCTDRAIRWAPGTRRPGGQGPVGFASLLALGALLAVGQVAPTTAAGSAHHSPAAEDGRVRFEVPERGLAIAFPPGWSASAPSTAERQAHAGSEDLADPETLVTAWAPPGPDGISREGCEVDRAAPQPGLTLDTLRDVVRDSIAASQEGIVGAIEVEDLDLAAGHAFHLSYAYDAEVAGATVRLYVEHYGVLGDDLLMVTCAGDRPRSRRWRHIADSLELTEPAPDQAQPLVPGPEQVPGGVTVA